jgi:hypothetical protein
MLILHFICNTHQPRKFIKCIIAKKKIYAFVHFVLIKCILTTKRHPPLSNFRTSFGNLRMSSSRKSTKIHRKLPKSGRCLLENIFKQSKTHPYSRVWTHFLSCCCCCRLIPLLYVKLITVYGSIDRTFSPDSANCQILFINKDLLLLLLSIGARGFSLA